MRARTEMDRQMQDAMARSACCPYCEGRGMTRVVRPEWKGGSIGLVPIPGRPGQVERAAVAVNAHCICPFGRWMRWRLDSDMQDRIPDLSDVLEGRSIWRLAPKEDG